MTHIYKDAASPRLKELLAKAEAGAPEDRLSVVAEIDLARVAAGEAVQLFDKVFEDSSSATPASRAQSIQLMNSALREVANLVQAQARILQHTEDIMTMEQFIWCMETFKRIVRDELGDSPKADEIAEKFDLVQPPSKGVADAAVRVSFT